MKKTCAIDNEIASISLIVFYSIDFSYEIESVKCLSDKLNKFVQNELELCFRRKMHTKRVFDPKL